LSANRKRAFYANHQVETALKYRPLGQTGLYVSELCLGTMTFAGQGEMWSKIGNVDQAGTTRLVECALAAGINFIDTADVYSEGQSERFLGAALRDLQVPREDVVIATKVRGRLGKGPNAIGLSRGHVLDSIAGSLKRLGLEYVDLYQIHGIDLLTPIEETMRALDDLVRRGLVRYIGCSNLAAWQIMKALGVSAGQGLARFETVQSYYTIATRDLEREIVPAVLDQKLGLMVWSPLAGGLLSGKFSSGAANPADTRRGAFDFPPVDKERAFRIVDVLRPMAEKRGSSVARLALAWLLHQKSVMSVIVGAKTVEQLQDNLAASGVELDAEELAQIDKVSALTPEYPAWMIERQNSDPRPGVKR
jgi:aryl-alcohol dehydrogenase-like predicted oxidoreductase